MLKSQWQKAENIAPGMVSRQLELSSKRKTLVQVILIALLFMPLAVLAYLKHQQKQNNENKSQ